MTQGDQAWVALLLPIPPMSDPASTAMSALISILVHESEGRLYRRLIQSGDAAAVTAVSFSYRNNGFAFISAQATDPNKLPQLRQQLIDELTGFADQPVSDVEMERHRRELEEILRPLEQQGPAAFADLLVQLLGEGAGQGDWRRYMEWYEANNSVQRDAVQAAALRLFDPARMTTGYLLPAP